MPEKHILIAFLIVSGIDVSNLDMMREFFTYVKENL